MIKKITFVILFLGMAASQVTAAPRTKAQMKQAAALAINKHRSQMRMAPRADALKVLKTTANYEILGYEHGGFAIVSADDLVPEVLGVSTSEYSEGRNTNFQWWLEATNSVIEYAVENNVQLTTTAPDPALYPTEVGPLVTTKWDQDTPYNNMCPTFSGSTKCLTGCVATAMAQVLNYHKMPEHGEGDRTIYYPHNNHSGQAVTAHFGEDYYDWENMLDVYASGYNQTQADAVALLMRDCGVAADMMYGGPNEGSGAYSQDAADGLRKYFGYEDAQCMERDYYSETVWMDMVYRELSENGPLYYGGADFSMGGHAFVIHGYRADGKVLVNWGWSGDDDGYYDIALLNPSYYKFSYGQDMIIGVKSSSHSLFRTETVNVAAEGMLKQTVENLEGEGQIGSLTVTGPLNLEDLKYLRFLAGRDASGAESGEQLRSLNLSNSTLPGNTLPDSIFKDCSTLQRVSLPETTERIGRDAFNGCSHLFELRLLTRAIPELVGTRVFEGVPFGSSVLYVRSGMKDKYLKKAQWKDFGAKNIMEVGTSVQVRNAIRKYGEENPEFRYSVSGDEIQGEPELVCEATASSPAGRYPIVVKRGTIKNDNVDFIDGYLIVQKLDATATVGDFTREVGQPNPEFGFSSYDGLIALDSIPVWLEEPIFETTADENSPVGEYPIIVKSATAESYNFSFIAGTLTVTEATGPRVVTPPADLQTEEWLLTGLRYDPTEYTIDATQSLNIGIQGQDVYVQGLNLYLPEAWVKGTLENGKVTFAANQYYGDLEDDQDSVYQTYFAGCDASWFDGVSALQPIDVTFTVNEAGDRWTTATVLVVNTLTDGIAGFDFLKDVVLVKPYDVAATPKAPEISFYMPYDAEKGYGGLAMSFPPVDVDGNPLLTSKLSYIIYKDVEKTVSPIVIPALQEDGETFVDMTEIPYNFTDDYNIEAHGYAAYFYEPSNAFNRIGVQAIYRGGNEECLSEINWLILQPYADEATIFDFNALDKETTPVSTSTSHDGDITEDKVLKEGDVTLTISPCEVGNTPNRYWVDYNLQAIQLRLYGGKLTFEVPVGCTMEKIYFFASDWNDDNAFDNGEFDGQVWTGAANNVVLTIDDAKPNTKLNKIAVVVSGTSGVSTIQFQPVEVLHTFDLQGRELQGNAKGLVIEQIRTADGQVKTVKRMRK